MRETVMVKHAVTGREWLNNNKQPLEYAFTDLPGGRYRFVFHQPPEKVVTEILRFQKELNLFRFEIPEDGPQVKHWYYVSTDGVHYDTDQQDLIIEADTVIRYLPTDYWA